MGQNQRPGIAMRDDEIVAFLTASRNGMLATVGRTGAPHLVAMWFAIVDGAIWLETKAKSQKAVNLRRDARASFLIEDGMTYDTLRGVSFDVMAVVSENRDDLWKVGVSMYERYIGPYDESARAGVEGLIHKRIAVRLDVVRTRSWDHRKLGLPPTVAGGTTSPTPNL